VTRAEAAEKVAKLRRLAAGTNNEAEASSARRRADELIKQHNLTEVELSAGSRAAAFDDLLTELDGYVRKHQVPTVVFEVIEKMKKETKKEDKAKMLEKFATVVRGASLFLDVGDVKKVLDQVLTKHGVTI
jgi:hypothetical protein